MQIDTRKLKKLIIKAVPYVAFSYVGNLIGFAYRTAEGNGFQEKILPFMSNLGVAFARIFPSLHPFDLLFGLVLAGVMRLVLYVKSKNKKKFRQGEEYGSAVWGGEKDIEPYMDLSCPENNVILTKTESLTMGKPSAPKFARNKNILVIGGSGSGKTRFFVKPNLMQMHSSYVVTDPKGTVLVECGKMLERGRPKRVNGKVVYRRDDKGNYLKDKNGRYIPVYEPYKIKVFNTIDFAKSMHYNPFAYISKKNREKDILKFVEVLIKNTSSSQQPSGDDFWVKAEKLLYTAYIALIFAMYPEDEWNFETLIDMINNSECREDDEEFKNSIDLEFEIVECWLNGTKHDDPDVMEDYADLFETKPDQRSDSPSARWNKSAIVGVEYSVHANSFHVSNKSSDRSVLATQKYGTHKIADQKLELANQQNNNLIETTAVQAKQIEVMKPKADYCDMVLQSEGLMTISTIAKDYGKSAIWLNKWLHEHGIQYKQGQIWLLYQKYADRGYMKSKTHTVYDKNGDPTAKVHSYWTQQGRIFIYYQLKNEGILPLIEQDDS